MTFEELGLDNELIKAVEDLKFETPMPIQEKVIPFLLDNERNDLVALAQTGTGKTAAFGLPLIQNTNTADKKTQHVILAPTRELCLQIADDLTAFAKYKTKLNVAAVFGGASIDRQIQAVKKGAQIISATPGRLLDLINRKKVDLSQIQSVVLDEADEMLNMGFRDELEAILSETPKEKNTFLFSATMPKEVRSIANKFMTSPNEITVGRKNSGAENVEHNCYMVHARDRYLALKRIVDFYPEIYGIVFCRTRAETQDVAVQLMKDGYNAEPLHGDLSQQQRTAVMNKFRIKNIKLLVATDVAARGLDVTDLTHIINYNLPDDLEIYIHRSGRTGRAGKAGTSIVVANMKEKSKLQLIEKQLKKQFKYLQVPSGKEICEKQLFHLVDRMEKVEVDYSSIDSFLPEILKKLEWLDREELIKKFVSVEFNRFLDYYRDLPDLNRPGEKRSKADRQAGTPSGFTRFFINLGKTDDLKPVNVIGLVNDYTGSKDISIGDIEIMKNFSFFEADAEFESAILKGFKNKNFKGRGIVVEVAEGKRGEAKKNKKEKQDRRKERYNPKNRRGGGNKRNDSGRSKRRK